MLETRAQTFSAAQIPAIFSLGPSPNSFRPKAGMEQLTKNDCFDETPPLGSQLYSGRGKPLARSRACKRLLGLSARIFSPTSHFFLGRPDGDSGLGKGELRGRFKALPKELDAPRPPLGNDPPHESTNSFKEGLG